MTKLKYTYSDAKKIFKNYGCVLLSSEDEYKNISSKLRYRCKCADIAYTTLNNYIHSVYHLCKKCTSKAKSKNCVKYTYEQIKEIFENYGCTLLTPKEEYKNLFSYVKYRCKCSSINTVRMNSYLASRTHLCTDCWIESKDEIRYNAKLLNDYVEEHKITLLEEYTNLNSLTIIKGLCLTENCDQIFEKLFSSLVTRGGAYCKKCVITNSKDKREQTNIKLYNVSNTFQSEDKKLKIKETNLLRYGYKNPMQNPEVCEKSQRNSYLNKSYILPSGEEIKVQGYEPWALDLLLYTHNILEEDIITTRSEIPTINYYFEESDRVYFPDIYIISQNHIIEVKSDYTYEKEFEQNMAKRRATIEAGYNFSFWIFDVKKNLTILEGYDIL